MVDFYLGFESKVFLMLRLVNVVVKERKGRGGGKMIIFSNVG